ncbi:MAG: DUF2937 family protein [Pseudomonadota bacterium]
MRIFLLAAGLAGGLAFSQAPQFTQAYTQRLSGAVEELALVVDQFDRSAETAGLTRLEALAQLRGTTFLEQRRADMSKLFGRYERLRADLHALREKSGWLAPLHLRDPELLRATWSDYQPAFPMTREGLLCAALGAVLAALSVGTLSASLSPARRRRV